MEVRQVRLPDELYDLLYVLRKNRYHRNHIDCTWENYMDFVITEVYHSPNYISFLLYDNSLPVGYAIVQGPSSLNSEITITDMFLLKEYQGKRYLYILIDKVVEVAKNVGVKRIAWHSPQLDFDFWKTVLEDVGIKARQKMVMSVDIDTDFISNNTLNEKVNEIHESLQQDSN